MFWSFLKKWAIMILAPKKKMGRFFLEKPARNFLFVVRIRISFVWPKVGVGDWTLQQPYKRVEISPAVPFRSSSSELSLRPKSIGPEGGLDLQ